MKNIIYIDGKRYQVNRELLSSHGYIELTIGSKRPCERVVSVPVIWWRHDSGSRVYTSGEWISKKPNEVKA